MLAYCSFTLVVERLNLYRNGNDLGLYRITNEGNFGEHLASVSLADPSSSSMSPNHMLYYGPRYPDPHHSNLATVAFNLGKIFPCIAEKNKIQLSCARATSGEDGFNKGRAIIEAADSGNDLTMFGPTAVYALAIQTCPEFNKNCFPNKFALSVVCQLPRNVCCG